MTIQAIETRYGGARFRSRLEARWAVFLDHLGISWKYEPEGYLVGPDDDRQSYLPDFYLPDLDLWAEIKGRNLVPTEERTKLIYAATPSCGLPGPLRGLRLLLLGEFPTKVEPSWTVWQHGMTWREAGDEQALHGPGVYTETVAFRPGAVVPLDFYGAFTGNDNREPSTWNLRAFVSIPRDYGPEFGFAPDPRLALDPDPEPHGAIGRRVADAYTAGREARFEHGEVPQRHV